LQRGGNKISGLPPFQGGIKGGKSDMRVLQGIFFLENVLITPIFSVLPIGRTVSPLLSYAY